MSVGSPETAQMMQRVRVGMTGLAIVAVMIALASVIGTWRTRDTAVSAIGGANVSVVANMTAVGNSLGEKIKDEPLAELGAAPSTSSTATDKTADPNQQQDVQQNGESR